MFLGIIFSVGRTTGELRNKIDDNFEIKSEDTKAPNEMDFYTFQINDSLGQKHSLEVYRGKVTLVVNVASQCGFTDGHYNSLIRLKNVLQLSKFEVLAFPCNQFGSQEPDSDQEIQDFVNEVYHVNFPVFAKIDVLGENSSKAWQYLISSSGTAPNWNFWKYLVDENGHVVNAWGPRIPVEDIYHKIREVIDNIGVSHKTYHTHGEL